MRWRCRYQVDARRSVAGSSTMQQLQCITYSHVFLSPLGRASLTAELSGAGSPVKQRTLHNSAISVGITDDRMAAGHCIFAR